MSRRRGPIAVGLVVVSLASACSQTPDPTAACADVAASYGSEFTVAAAGVEEIGAVRASTPYEQDPELLAGLSPDTKVVVCYIDGITPAPHAPPEPGSTIREYDRSLVVVYDGEATPIAAGYSDTLRP